MANLHPVRRGRVLSACMAGLALWTAAHAAANPAVTSLLSPETTVWLGRTQVIPFRVAVTAAQDVVIEALSDKPDVLHVVRPASVLQGQSLGYVRVRGARAGAASLTLGNQTMGVTVRPAPSGGDAADGAKLIIVGPVNGAAVWGRVTAAVELWHAGDASLQPGAVRMRIAGDQVLQPSHTTPAGGAPWSVARFVLDADALPEGPVTLSAFVDGAPAGAVRAQPVALHVVRPSAEALIQGECEASLDTPRVGKQDPANRPRLGSSPEASGGTFVACHSAEPAWLFPLEVKEPGLYQVIVAASGDLSGGALPSVGVVLGESDRAVTASRLVDYRWHRLPVGHPFALKAGSQVLSVRFMNDFFAPDYADRNLYLDRYEVARIGDSAASGDAYGDGGMAMMAMAAPAMKMAAAVMAGSEVRIAFLRPLHNLPLRGDLLIEGTTWWENPDDNPPPVVTLKINGEPVMVQRAPDPRFRVNPGAFRAGTNTVQLLARLDDGAVGETPVQAVVVDAAAVMDSPPRRYLRFGVEDAAWGDAFQGRLIDRDRADGHRVAYSHSNGRDALTLPEALEGAYELYLEARGDEFEGPAVATVYLQTNDAPAEVVATWSAHRWWDDARLGVVTLPRGPKRLIVAFENDRFTESQGDRNLYIKGVSLRDVAPAHDVVPPTVRLLYPAASTQAVAGVDAVVAEVSDNESLEWVDLVIDGKRLGMQPERDPAIGRLVFPLLARGLPAGQHAIKVRARDRAGNQSDSREATVLVLEAPAAGAAATPYTRAVRLLNRFGFGPDTQALAAVLTMGERAYLESCLAGGLDEPGERAALARGEATWPARGGEYEVAMRTIQHLQLTPNPIRARFVLWAENHFSTWMRKTEGFRKAEEHAAFLRLGVAPFPALLEASATSPAMLVYLDQQRSFAGSLNENYAREIMELHTLGVHGGYTQADVTTLAGLLNGWTVSEEAALDGRGYPLTSVFRFDPTLNDGRVRRVLGMAFDSTEAVRREDQVRLALELLAAHPGTATHISRQLVEHYVSAPAPEPMVADLAAVYQRTGGDMRALLLAIAAHPDFWAQEHDHRMARPIDYAVRLSRVTDSDDTWALHDFLRTSGMGMFDCATPNGYPEEDVRYADSNAMLQRWKLARRQEWRLSTMIPGSWRGREGADRTRWMQDVVDLSAARLTGRLLGEESNLAALNLLGASTNAMDRRMMDVAAFIGALPEASLR